MSRHEGIWTEYRPTYWDGWSAAKRMGDIVRCRDCRYFERGGTLTVAGHEHKMLNNCHRHTYDGGYACISPDEDDFCAWGERRTDA